VLPRHRGNWQARPTCVEHQFKLLAQRCTCSLYEKSSLCVTIPSIAASSIAANGLDAGAVTPHRHRLWLGRVTPAETGGPDCARQLSDVIALLTALRILGISEGFLALASGESGKSGNSMQHCISVREN
jgi:hypothetical protein